MRKVQRVVVVILLLVFGGCIFGCSAEYWTGRIEPVTRIGVSAWGGGEFKDTKNNDILLQEAEFDPATKTFKIGHLAIRNNSSEVIDADAARMVMVEKIMQIQVDYQRQIGMNIQGALLAGGEAASNFLSTLPSMSFDLGSLLGNANAWMAPTVSTTQPAW